MRSFALFSVITTFALTGLVAADLQKVERGHVVHARAAEAKADNEARDFNAESKALNKRTFNLSGWGKSQPAPAPVPQYQPQQNPSWPSPSWDCNGSGQDGWSYDPYGNSCPSDTPQEWKYFGKNHGWLPYKGWQCADNWSPPSSFAQGCSLATWWIPSISWQFPSWIISYFPEFWGQQGWHAYNGPSYGWQCDNSGNDGWSYDWRGNGCPSSYPSGWKYFGKNKGWHPKPQWQIPSAHWYPPSSWQPTQCTWWKPTSQWWIPTGFGCPSWWPKINLLGIFSWRE